MKLATVEKHVPGCSGCPACSEAMAALYSDFTLRSAAAWREFFADAPPSLAEAIAARRPARAALLTLVAPPSTDTATTTQEREAQSELRAAEAAPPPSLIEAVVQAYQARRARR